MEGERDRLLGGLARTSRACCWVLRRGIDVGTLERSRGTIHDLRRASGIRIARIVPIHVLKEYMGHAKIQTTQECYLAAEAVAADAARTRTRTSLSAGTGVSISSMRMTSGEPYSCRTAARMTQLYWRRSSR